MISSTFCWAIPPKTLILELNTVHVWQAHLNLPPTALQDLGQLLSAEEKTRAARFRFPTDRDRFIAARGILRTLLGRYLGLPPQAVSFCYGPQGKPALAHPLPSIPLEFNVSHAKDLGLFAIAWHRPVGVDVEQLNCDRPWQDIAPQCFTPGEQAVLFGLPQSSQCHAFYTGWTRKEAYIKATGQGLSIPLDQFEVSLQPDAPAALLNTQWNPPDAQRWSLLDLTPASGYVAALAVAGDRIPVQGWQWRAETH